MMQPPSLLPDASDRVNQILSQAYSLEEALDDLGERTGSLPRDPTGDSGSRLASILGSESKRDAALHCYRLTAGQIDSLRDGTFDMSRTRTPPWHGTAARVVQATQVGFSTSEPVTGIAQDSPAGIFLGPFLAVADEQFAGCDVRKEFQLSSESWAAMRRCLADRLLRVCGKTLDIEWNVFRAKHTGARQDSSPPPGQVSARDFAALLGRGGAFAASGAVSRDRTARGDHDRSLGLHVARPPRAARPRSACDRRAIRLECGHCRGDRA